jgi:hypothetical protein
MKIERQKALDGTLWRILLGKGYEFVVRLIRNERTKEQRKERKNK